MNLNDHLFELVSGAYVFAAGAYLFGWKILMIVLHIRKIVGNHMRHELDAITTRLNEIEDRNDLKDHRSPRSR